MSFGQQAQDRQRALAWAADVAADPTVVYLDTETTGLGRGSEIVDIAVIDADGLTLLDTLVQPNRPIPDDAVGIHGISIEMVADAPTWREVYPLLVEAITNRRVIVFNADFDRGMVDEVCSQNRLVPPPGRWQCAMKAYAAYHGEWNPRTRDYKWQRLNVAASTFNHDPGGHRALVDSLVCRLVVHSMAELYRAEFG